VFLRKAALRPVQKWAVVDDAAVEAMERELEEDEDLQDVLDVAYRDLERRQPALSQWLAEEVALRRDELAQSLGYFLIVTVYRAFREAFPTRLGEVDQSGLEIALDTLRTDEELRAADPLEVLDSDDVVAMGQPAVLGFVQHHLEEAISQAGGESDLEDIDRIYRAILIEVIALSAAVSAPAGQHNESALA
jgi:hypothetical protein